MKAIEITAPGKPEVLRLADRPAPQVGAGELLIKVAAAGVNRPDVLQRKGLYPVPPGASDIPGLEVAGTIVEGDKAAMVAAGFAVGDRVCALVAGGGYAELCAAPVEQCLPVPEGLSDIEAASLPETFFTVWSNVFERGRLQPGETLLVHGGTSGIGVTAIQLGKAFGATVIATAGSDDKCAACLKLGADHAINYKTHDFVAEVQRLTNQRGTDVILDMVAGDYLARDVVASDHVEDDVDAALGSDAAHLLDEVVAAVVDRVVGTERDAGGALVVAARGGDHDRAVRLGELDRGDADAAGAAVDQEPVAGLERAALEHVVPDGEEGLGDCAG